MTALEYSLRPSVTEIEFKAILISEREKALDYLRLLENSKFFYYHREPNFPLPWDINCGYCNEFAGNIEKKCLEAEVACPSYYLEEDEADEYQIHDFILFNGKFYDAECIDGVNDWRDLPIFGDNPRPTISQLKQNNN